MLQTSEVIIPLLVGRNEIEVKKDISENFAYKFEVYRKSNEARLDNLEILNVDNLNFDSNVLDYDKLILNKGKDYIRIIPTLKNSNSEIKIKYNNMSTLIQSGIQSSKINLENNRTEIIVEVSPEDETFNATEYNLVILKENINELKTLSLLKAGEELLNSFESEITDYDSIIVDYNTEEIEVKASSDDNFTLEGLGLKTLKIGQNNFEIKVISNEKTTVYKVGIYRKSNNYNISNVKIDVQIYEFNEEIEKEITISDEIEEITLEISPEDKVNTEVRIDNKELSGEELIRNIELNEEEKEIKILVLAEDRSFEKEYTVKIKRASTGSDLNLIEINREKINTVGIYNYPLESVSNSTDSLELLLEKKSEDQEVYLKVNGEIKEEIKSNQLKEIDLIEGNNTIVLEVEFEGEKNTYTLDIRRKMTNTELSIIILANEEYTVNSNSFDLGIFNSETEEIKIKPILEEGRNSTVKYNNNLLDENGEFILLLEEGENEYTLLVIAEEGNEKEYLIKAYKASGITGLSELKINGKELNLSNKENGIIEIEAGEIKSDSLKLEVIYEKENLLSKVYDEDNNELEDKIGKIEASKFGESTLEILVESEDGLNKLTYIISLNLIEDKQLGEIEGLKVEYKDDDYIIICNSVLNAEEYEFYISTSKSGTYSSLGESNSGTKGVIIDDWGYGEKYYFKAEARNKTQSTESSVINFITEIKVSKPTNLEAIEIGDTYLEIEWKNDDLGAKFKIYVDEKEKYTEITSNSYKIIGLTPNTEYDVKVESYNEVSNVFSTEEEFKTKYSTNGLSKATNLKIENISNMNCKITVDSVYGASEYEFYMKTSYSTNIDEYKKIGTVAYGPDGVENNLNYNTKYYFYVIVRNSTAEVKSNVLEFSIP